MAYAAEAQIPLDQFWRMTWPEYSYRIQGYEARQNREWERTRELGAWIARFNGVKTKTGKEVEGHHLWALPLDAERLQAQKAETDEAFLKRMASINYYKRPT